MVSRLALKMLALCTALGVQAAEVAGVKLEDRAKVGAADAVLNGAGLRKRAFFNVYAIGLYLPDKKAGAADATAPPCVSRADISPRQVASMSAG